MNNLIIAFAKDWNDVPTCTTHVLREMAKTSEVLWISSIGMRRPSLTSSRDTKRILQRLQTGLRRAEWKENQLRVLMPLIIPRAQSVFARSINCRLLKWMVNREARNWSSAETELWTFMPSGVDFAGCFNEKKLVYYCPDDWSKFSTYDATWMTYCENTLLQKANVVFATSRFLESKFHPLAGNRVHYMPHGVNHAHFATALASETIIPDEIIHLPKPVIGFYGNIYDWIDFDLLAKLAQERPQWSFVMIGPLYTNISRFADVPNVYFLGRREQRCLPPYCKGFDAAIIPYKLTDPRMESVNPVKMRELLAAGVPIAASDLPEARRVSEHVITARTVPEFLAALEIHLENSRCDPQLRNKISDERKSDDWRIKVQQIRSIVEQS